jgi:hypothetical protein
MGDFAQLKEGVTMPIFLNLFVAGLISLGWAQPIYAQEARDALTVTLDTLVAFLPRLIAALLILIAGWVLAKLLGLFVRRGFEKMQIDQRLEKYGVAQTVNVNDLAGRLTYILILLFVIVAVLAMLQLEITQPLNDLLRQVTTYLPRLVGAGVILLVAYLLAALLRGLVTQLLQVAGLDARLSQRWGAAEPREAQVKVEVQFSKTIGTVVFWLVLLFALPPFLSTLQLEALTAPIQRMLDKLLAAVPNIAGAALLALIGWFVAKIVREVVRHLLAATGLDRGAQHLGLARLFGGRSASWVLGMIVYALILISTFIAAVGILELRVISDPAEQMLAQLLNALPLLFGALIILIAAYIIARVAATAVSHFLAGMGFDAVPAKLGLAPEQLPEGARKPSEILGTLTLLGIMLFALLAAAEILGFGTLASLVQDFVGFAAKVLFALLILGAGLYLANLVRGMMKAAGQPGWATGLAGYAVIILAAAIALEWIGVSNTIIALALGAPLVAVAVAAAIALGLGGRDVAARWLEAYFPKRE